jgi:large subunit ribosomal protein L24e
MVVKTDKCAFSEFNIFPGHGMKFVKRDGTPLMVISRKAKSLMMQRKKPAKLTWTQRWRIMNKKGLAEGGVRKRTRRVVKVQRAIVGTSADDIKKLRTQKPELRSAQREAALRETKERNKAKKADKIKNKAVAKANQPKVKAPKGGNKNARGGAKR